MKNWLDSKTGTNNFADSLRRWRRIASRSRLNWTKRSRQPRTRRLKWRIICKTWETVKRRWKNDSFRSMRSWRLPFLLVRSISCATKTYSGLFLRTQPKRSTGTRCSKVCRFLWCRSTCLWNSWKSKIGYWVIFWASMWWCTVKRSCPLVLNSSFPTSTS